MALLNRNLTDEEARKMLAQYRRSSPGRWRSEFWRLLEDSLTNPWPHVVVYDGTKTTHVPPDRFYFGPTTSTWIVPGTLEEKL